MKFGLDLLIIKPCEIFKTFRFLLLSDLSIFNYNSIHRINAFASAFHPSPFRTNQDPNPIQSNLPQQTAPAPYEHGQALPSPSSLQQMTPTQYHQQRHLAISDWSQSSGNRSEPISFWRIHLISEIYTIFGGGSERW